MANVSALTEELMSRLAAESPDSKFRKMVTPMPDGTEIEWVMKYPPTPAAYSAFREKAVETSAAERASAPRYLFNSMVAYPSGPELKDVLKSWPGLVDTWAGECAEFTGLVRGTRQEK